MPSKFITAINPQILKWAREDLGISTSQVAQKIQRVTDTYERWERGEEGIPFDALFKLGKALNLHVADFYRSDPPKTRPRPKDCRRFYGVEVKPLSPKTLAFIRKAQGIQDFLMDLDLPTERVFSTFAFEQVTAKEAAQVLRKESGLTDAEQLESIDASQFYTLLRNIIEYNSNIYTLQWNLNIDGVEGMALSHPVFPFCIVNTNPNFHIRIFSLLHEIGHVVIGESSLSGAPGSLQKSTDKNRNDTDWRKERFCNQFAAEFLLPEILLKSELRLHGIGSVELAIRDESIFTLSERLKISKTAFLIRLAELELSSAEVVYSKINELSMRTAATKSAGGGDHYKNTVSWYGRKLLRKTIAAVDTGMATTSEISSTFNLKLEGIERVKDLLRK